MKNELEETGQSILDVVEAQEERIALMLENLQKLKVHGHLMLQGIKFNEVERFDCLLHDLQRVVGRRTYAHTQKRVRTAKDPVLDRAFVLVRLSKNPHIGTRWVLEADMITRVLLRNGKTVVIDPPIMGKPGYVVGAHEKLMSKSSLEKALASQS
mgnify:FL=1